MASQETTKDLVCPICFVSHDVLKRVGRCTHTFCTQCLGRHLEQNTSSSKAFLCPICQVDCPLSSDGIDALVDFTGIDVAAASVSDMTESDIQQACAADMENSSKELNDLVDVKCHICHHLGKEVDAGHLCLGCDQLHLCGDCKDAHKRSKATRDHMVVPFKMQTADDRAMCMAHNAPMTSFCTTCNSAACMICVAIDHSEHDVQKLRDVIQTEFDKMKVVFEQCEKELADLKDLKKDLSVLVVVASSLDRRDTLLREIEDHAQRSVDQIVTWKEDIKHQVNQDFQVIKDIPKALTLTSKSIEKLQLPVSCCSKLVSRLRPQAHYLEDLMSSRKVLEAARGDTYDKADGKRVQSQLEELSKSNHSFVPDASPLSLGMLRKQPTGCLGYDNFEPKSVFEHEMVNGSGKRFIPCLANIGPFFAIAHPIKKDELGLSNSIDIYKFPWTFQKTITIGIVYDMSSTLDGKLAVLSAGGRSTCCVKLFDPGTGGISLTPDIDEPNPISLGVGNHNRYAILGGEMVGKKQVTVVDKENKVKHKVPIARRITSGIGDPERISFGGRYIFVMGSTGVAQYDVEKTGLEWVTTMQLRSGVYQDISATPWGSVFFLNVQLPEKDLFLTRYNEKTSAKKISAKALGDEEKCRIAVSGCYIVTSHGRTFTVFKY